SATEPQNTPSNAAVLLMAPQGDQVLAKINNDIYVVTLPITGGETPKISVADPASAQFPARKLTKLGGEFPSWSSNGKTVYFTLGNAFFTYNIEEAKLKEDELKKKKAAEEKAKEAGET
ncbi:MAG TPA: amidohydrolase, partial [Cyclobacteriaceae bacterium]|nr:amidohydrolase [Cyclobacteriaceae bacterium]